VASLKMSWVLRAGQLIAKWSEDEQPLTSAILEMVSSTDEEPSPSATDTIAHEHSECSERCERE
jgi:hypothetical protein